MAAGLAAARGIPMAEKDASRSVRALEQAAGMLAVLAVSKVVRVGWRRITGAEPPATPDDQQVPLGRAVVWTLLLGAAITTARMIAIRYAANLLPRRQREALAAAQANSPDTPAP